MAHVREIITEGLALRMQKSDTEKQIKVRQPLSEMVYAGNKLDAFYEQIIADEVNVKNVKHGKENFINKEIDKALEEEGFVRELIRVVQSARKKAGLNVDDRIKLSVTGEKVPKDWKETLMNEVLAVELTEENYAYDEVVKVNDKQLTISLEKN